MHKMKLFLICVFLFVAFSFFLYTVKQDEQMNQETLVNSKTVPVSDSHPYYMKIDDNEVVIYNRDHSVYEFTDIDEEFLPASLILELKEGKYFHNQQELYEFLETYTS